MRRGAEQGRGREEEQGHDGGPDDRRVSPRPGSQPLGGRRPPGHDRPAVEESLQVVGEFLRSGVAVGRLLAQRLQYNRLQLRGDGGVQSSGRDGIVVGDLPDERVAVASLEGRAERDELVERRAQRIDVASVVDDAPAGQELFGAGVA